MKVSNKYIINIDNFEYDMTCYTNFVLIIFKFTADSAERRVCQECQMNWCFIHPETDVENAGLECQDSTKRAICHTCQYKKPKSVKKDAKESTKEANVKNSSNIIVPKNLFIGAKGLASKRPATGSPLEETTKTKKKKTTSAAQTAGLRPSKATATFFQSCTTPNHKIKRFEFDNKRDKKFIHKIALSKQKQAMHLIRHHLGLKLPKGTRKDNRKIGPVFKTFDDAENTL